MRRRCGGGAEAGAGGGAEGRGGGSAERGCGAEARGGEAGRTSSSVSSPTITHESPPSSSTAHSRAERRSVESKVEKKARPVAVRP